MSITADPRRLVLEHAAMRERWGSEPCWCSDAARHYFWWEYTINLEGNRFPIRVVYPEDYPASPPELLLCRSLPAGTPHLFPNARTPVSGSRMCWFYPGETARTRNTWNPATDTAAIAVGAAHRWCLAFMVWISTGNWPVPDAV